MPHAAPTAFECSDRISTQSQQDFGEIEIERLKLRGRYDIKLLPELETLVYWRVMRRSPRGSNESFHTLHDEVNIFFDGTNPIVREQFEHVIPRKNRFMGQTLSPRNPPLRHEYAFRRISCLNPLSDVSKQSAQSYAEKQHVLRDKMPEVAK